MGSEVEAGLEIVKTTFWVLTAVNLYACINFILYTLIRDPETEEISAHYVAVLLPFVYWLHCFRDWMHKKVNEF